MTATELFRSTIQPPVIDHVAAQNLTKPLHKLLYTVDQMEYTSVFQGVVVPECREIQSDKVFQFNYLVWTFFFFLGLQFTHLDKGILQQFVIDPEAMKNWPPILWAVFFAGLAFIGYTLWYIFSLYASIGILFYYELLLVGIIGGIVAFAYLNSDHYEFHFHHYCLGMLVMTFACYQNTFVSAIHAIFNGIMIEGATRWGYDPMFYYHEGPTQAAAPTPKRQKTKAIVQKLKQSKARADNANMV
jgi:hypothetical protein